MRNVYNVLHKKVALRSWQMPYELEHLAQMLVKSGRFRIEAREKENFVRFFYPPTGTNLAFSYRELHDPDLLVRTKGIIDDLARYDYRQKSQRAAVVETEIERLRYDVSKIIGVPADIEMKLARILVQSIPPVVMWLLLLEGTELFVSYAYSVGDMLDIQSWQTVGDSSGLQSTDHTGSAVFVSCGGDPFGNPEKTGYLWDGAHAMARMMIIAGQELGHYSDIIRNKKGRPISRHASDLGARKAKDHVHDARQNDIHAAFELHNILDDFGLMEITSLERRIKFFRKMKRKGLTVINTQRRINNKTRSFIKKCKKNGLGFVHKIQPDEDGHWVTQIGVMLEDMQFNLAPKADCYSRENPVEEDAIACVEALARVPQQVNKWGHETTKRLMCGLYHVYYKEVIPACKQTFADLTGQKYSYETTNKNLARRIFERVLYRKRP